MKTNYTKTFSILAALFLQANENYANLYTLSKENAKYEYYKENMQPTADACLDINNGRSSVYGSLAGRMPMATFIMPYHNIADFVGTAAQIRYFTNIKFPIEKFYDELTNDFKKLCPEKNNLDIYLIVQSNFYKNELSELVKISGYKKEDTTPSIRPHFWFGGSGSYADYNFDPSVSATVDIGIFSQSYNTYLNTNEGRVPVGNFANNVDFVIHSGAVKNGGSNENLCSPDNAKILASDQPVSYFCTICKVKSITKNPSSNAQNLPNVGRTALTLHVILDANKSSALVKKLEYEIKPLFSSKEKEDCSLVVISKIEEILKDENFGVDIRKIIFKEQPKNIQKPFSMEDSEKEIEKKIEKNEKKLFSMEDSESSNLGLGYIPNIEGTVHIIDAISTLENEKWKNGLSKEKAGFLLPNDSFNRNSYKIGKKVVLGNEETRKIKSVQPVGNVLIIWLEGGILNVDTHWHPASYYLQQDN